MKNSEIITLANLGVLSITNHSLDAAHAYKVFKFKKAINKQLESIAEMERGLVKEAGIEDGPAFDARYQELHDGGLLDAKQQEELSEMESKMKKLSDLRAEFYREEPVLDIKTIPYEQWKKLQDENREVEINGKKRDILVGYAEMLLEGVLWNEPEEITI